MKTGILKSLLICLTLTLSGAYSEPAPRKGIVVPKRNLCVGTFFFKSLNEIEEQAWFKSEAGVEFIVDEESIDGEELEKILGHRIRLLKCKMLKEGPTIGFTGYQDLTQLDLEAKAKEQAARKAAAAPATRVEHVRPRPSEEFTEFTCRVRGTHHYSGVHPRLGYSGEPYSGSYPIKYTCKACARGNFESEVKAEAKAKCQGYGNGKGTSCEEATCSEPRKVSECREPEDIDCKSY